MNQTGRTFVDGTYNATAPANPCGLVARSYFTDTYALYKVESNGIRTPIVINETDIAWESDVKYKFRNAYENLPEGKTWQSVQWIDVENGKN